MSGSLFKASLRIYPKTHFVVWALPTLTRLEALYSSLDKQFASVHSSQAKYAVEAASERLEMLDWYHLKENLFKIGGSLKRLQQAEAWLWQGCMEEAKALFQDCTLDQTRNFCRYLTHHRQRIVNYARCQAEGMSIRSGAVESALKQIDARMKLTGAQWKAENVPQALSVRCAYLNGQLKL